MNPMKRVLIKQKLKEQGNMYGIIILVVVALYALFFKFDPIILCIGILILFGGLILHNTQTKW